MQVKIHYRITQDRAGIPQNFCAARRFVIFEDQPIADMARRQLATDYQIPLNAVEICTIED